jgi:hypothetical protein
MSEEVTNALAIIKKACASVVADLQNHQLIQSAIGVVEAELTKPLTDTSEHNTNEQNTNDSNEEQ